MRHLLVVLLSAAALAATPAWSQGEKTAPPAANPFASTAEEAPAGSTGGPALKLNFPGEFGITAPDGGIDGEGAEAAFSASFQVDKASGKGTISVKAEINPGWHIYSLTQAAGGPQKSALTVKADGAIKVGEFTPDVQPAVHFDSEVYRMNLEEHTGTVVWTAPLLLPPGMDPENTKLAIRYTGQVCTAGATGRCIPLDETLTAEFAGYLGSQGTPGEYRPKTANMVWRGHVEPAVVAPGSKAKLVLTATPDEGWHLYPYSPTDNSDQIAKPTLVVLSNAAGWEKSAVQASKEPKTSAPAGGSPSQSYYEGEVTFTIDLTVPETAKPGEALLTGFLGFQTCDANSCKAPSGAKFSVAVPVAAAEKAGKLPLQFEVAGYKRVAEIAAQQPVASSEVNFATLGWQLGLSLIGGFLLNLMPCVLPVLGLKIMSFVKQGGQSRAAIFELNAAYTLGLMAVFLALATAGAFLNLGWGEQMTSLWFRLGMLVLMFAFGLSFLGVWEMTVPGLAGSQVVEATQGREGLPGAFFKGVFTTILGVSCSGPFLGGVFGYTLTQPWWVTYLIFTFVGLGMASPFLAIGLFPRLISYLPKPGEWMNTFKHVMGFVMLGVVIYVFSTLGEKYYIPALVLLLGVGFGLWWIGRVPVYEDSGKQLKAWLVGSVAAAAIGWFGFAYLGPVKELYEWKPYYAETLAQYQQQNKTVMLDFTADWCLNCQLNFRSAINTPAVKEVVEKNGVVAVKADWTDENEAIKNKLAELSSNSIPILAIYPAGKPEEVIILRDLVTQQQVLEALQKAGPSQGIEPAVEQPASRVAKAGSGN